MRIAAPAAERFYLAPLYAGRGRIALRDPGEGLGRASDKNAAFAGRAPHPDPLPVKNGERESNARLAPPKLNLRSPSPDKRQGDPYRKSRGMPPHD